jgi:hypothetical protein
MKIYTCNFSNNLVFYAKEMYNIFNNSEFNTSNYDEANYILTCLSDELNYPIYGNMGFALPNDYIYDVVSFIKNNFNLYENKKIITFYHTTQFYIDNVINICYTKNDDDDRNIVICPPAIKKYIFNKNIDKKYFLSFKGNFSASENRLNIVKKFEKYNSDKNIIIDRNDNNYDYDDLMNNSLFGIVVEGDLPWSYRFTECINSGTIPIIIKPKNKNIFAFSELIDYSSFSIIKDESEIDDLMQNILPNLSIETIQNMLISLENVNNKYFITRETQLNGILDILELKK